jgi:hypothetical protein
LESERLKKIDVALSFNAIKESKLSNQQSPPILWSPNQS